MKRERIELEKESNDNYFDQIPYEEWGDNNIENLHVEMGEGRQAFK
jgi:hypothetical protein